ncbi:hypothetical protein SLE2022_091700 [Rubroshorea leprosula]
MVRFFVEEGSVPSMESLAEPYAIQKRKPRRRRRTKNQNLMNKMKRTEEKAASTTRRKGRRRKGRRRKEENGELSDTLEEKQELAHIGHENGKEKVVVSGKNAEEANTYAPLKSFADSKLPDNVLDCCKNFKSPSPIQAHAWPFSI